MESAKYASQLYNSIRQVVRSARRNAYRAVNFAMVEAYWNIGRLIVEEAIPAQKMESTFYKTCHKD